MQRRRVPWFSIRAVFILALSFAPPALAVEFEVDSQLDLRDNLPGDGLCAAGSFLFCTLRAAIEEANALPGADVIKLPSGRHVLTRPGINEDAAANGDLDIIEDLVIEGQGADLTIVDAAGLDRVFHLPQPTGADPPRELTLEKLTVTGGVAADPADPTPSHESGGGILVQNGSTLRLRYVRITDNMARKGGGIALLGAYRTTIFACEVTGNTIQGVGPEGAGLHFGAGEDRRLNISYSTFSDNRCVGIPVQDCYAGIHVLSSGTLADDGLALYNSTISGNGGIGVYLNESNGFIGHSTIYGNQSYGLRLKDFVGMANAVAAQNTIIADNDFADCLNWSGTWLLQGFHNLSSDTSCDLSPAAGDLIADPELYRLGFYPPPSGRIAPSHHPRWLSPVVDAGMPFPALTTEQDDHPRLSDGELPSLSVEYDIGSIEVLPCVTTVDRLFDNQTLLGGVQSACRRVIADPNVLINGSVVFTARESVFLGEGFTVYATASLDVVLSREAGAPAP